MRNWTLAMLGLVVANAASADIVKLRDRTFVKVDNKRDRVVVAHIMLGRFTSSATGGALMIRAVAIKAQEQGLPRFAILRDTCDGVSMNGSALYSQCKLTAQLLGPTDVVTAAHKDAPRFVDVATTLALPLLPRD